MLKKTSCTLRALTIVVVTIVFSTANALAETYYWKPGATQGLWTEISNWSTESISGADAAELPDSSDSLYGTGDYNFDLEGGSYTLAGWPTPGDWNNHYMTIANGTLAFTGGVSTHSGQINVGDGGVLNLPLGSSFTPGMYSGAGMTINVNAGGAMSVAGSVRLYNGSFSVASGGSLTFAPSNLRFGAESHGYALTFSNEGTLSLPNGFHFDRWDIASVDSGSTYTFTSSGTLNLGGSIDNAPNSSGSKPGPFAVVLSGGTVNVTGDMTFDVTSVSIENNVTFNVDAGKTANLSAADFSAGSSMTKTGDGLVVLPTTAPMAAISAGGVSLLGDAYDLSNVSFSSGTTIAISTLGATISASSATMGNATFTTSLASAPAGTVVLYSSVPAVLEKAQVDLAASAPSGLSLVIDNNALSLERASGSANTFKVSGDLLSSASWGGGAVPDAGAEVAIAGDNVVATYSSGEIPAWASIEVKGGATLRIATNATPPPIMLNKNARLEVAGGANLTFASVGGLSCVGNDSSLPVLEVATNATLTVAGGMKFKNVDFRLFGTVTKPSDADASPVFGYAESGETSYFAFTADGGVFDFHSNQNAGCGAVSIVCPAVGGTVIPVGAIVLRNASRNVTGWADFGNWEFGVNNPTSVGFDVLADGTAIDCSAFFYASGAAHLTLVNGSCIRRNSHCGGHYFSQAIQNSATIAIGEGCYLDFTTGDGVFGIDSQSTVDAVTVRDGGIYNVTYNSGGWGQGVFVSDGGVLGVGKLYSSSSSTRAPRTDLLQGFGSARLDGDLSIASANVGVLGNTDWDRHATMANVPFSGAGNVMVTNGVPAYPFTVTMRNGANTATGAIKVAKAVGDAETMLYFANGANWAGTVVAGDVALTNLVDGAAASTNTFGAVDLAAGSTFPVRVWKTGGAIVAHDGLDVTRYLKKGGKIEFVAMDEPLALGDRFVLGTIGAESDLPKLSRGWMASRTEDGRLEVSYSRAFAVILR